MGDRVGVELLYNPVKKVQFELQLSLSYRQSCSYRWRRSYRRDVVRKATPGRRVPREALMSWGPEKMLIRCSKESQHPAEWIPGPPVEYPESEKDTTLTAIRVGVKILQFMFGLQHPLTRKHWITFSKPCNKVRDKYFVFLRLYYCVVIML